MSDAEDVITLLNPRDAFFGGRTNSIKLLCKNVRMKYVDFCSLYPTVMFYDDYPIGHPVKIVNPEKYDRNWFGFIKCKVLPPHGLYHPVLPVRIGGKLLFPLCRVCALKNIKKCKHSAEDRCFIGTWCSNEVNKAIEKGYVVKEIYEVWHFEKKGTILFKDYIKSFLKIKMENSKPPKNLEEFKKKIWEKLEIELNDIIHNPGMRAIAKLCLNSLWGKLAQRTNLPQNEFVDTLEDFLEIIDNDSFENVREIYENDEVTLLGYTLKDVFESNRNNVNIFVAAFTTANARMRLYDVLDKLGEQVVAFDTDSCWYLKGSEDIEVGSGLGDLTDELNGDIINHWVSTGPKSYVYTTLGGEYKCKIKGFILNFENSEKINMESMINLVRKEIDEIFTVNKKKITRNIREGKILNMFQEKKLQVTCSKRVVLDNYDSLPFGY